MSESTVEPSQLPDVALVPTPSGSTPHKALRCWSRALWDALIQCGQGIETWGALSSNRPLIRLAALGDRGRLVEADFHVR